MMTARSASRPGWIPLLVRAALGGVWAIAACSAEAPASRDGVNKVPSREAADQPKPASEGSGAEPPRSQNGNTPPPSRPDLYDPDTLSNIELTFDDVAMAVLTSTSEADNKTWVHGRFKLGAISFADVGVRRKGSQTFRSLPAKAPLKVKFNKWVKGQKLHGLEEMTLNSMSSDPTFLAERLTYHVFRSVGLPAPRANTAHLTINGEDYGLFANIETPDENFLARVFGSRARTLYEVKSRGSSWLPDATSGFEVDIPLPGAPAGTKPDLDLLLQAVAAAKDATLLTDLDARLHTTQWLRFSAAEALTAHCDGYAYGVLGYSHNYYVAGDVDGRFSLTPWSADLTLSEREVVDAASPPGNTVVARCRNSATCWGAYKAEMQSVLAACETLDLVSLARKWHDQIDALARADPKREKSLASYERETANLYEWLPARPGVIRAQLGL